MWTQGTFQYRDCQGHERQVGEVGDVATFCQVILEEGMEGMFRIVWETTNNDTVVEFSIGEPFFFDIAFGGAVAKALEDGIVWSQTDGENKVTFSFQNLGGQHLLRIGYQEGEVVLFTVEYIMVE